MELNYASKGVANAGLATGIIGTALGAMNGLAGGSLLLSRGNTGGTLVDRHELEENMTYQQELMAKDLEIASLRSEKISDQKDVEVYRQVKSDMNALEAQINALGQQIAAQAVQNQSTKDSFQILQERMDNHVTNLAGAIEREKDTRKANDNLIVTYTNATFTPKMVVTTSYSGGTITPSSTQQQTYNPLPCCDCND